jgi:hypothetical protein
MKLQELDEATYDRARKLIGHDEELWLAVSEVWWAAYRAGIRDGVDAAHQRGEWKSQAVCPLSRPGFDQSR